MTLTSEGADETSGAQQRSGTIRCRYVRRPSVLASERTPVMKSVFWRPIGRRAPYHSPTGIVASRPANTTTETKMTYVVQLARTRYAGTEPYASDQLLMEREGIDLSPSTVRRMGWRGADHGRAPAAVEPPRHRVRRKRMFQEGMLLQIDGSRIGGWGTRRPCCWPWTMPPARCLTLCSARRRHPRLLHEGCSAMRDTAGRLQ